ncbi:MULTISPECIES: FG-GAP-like repeat-containing protein [Paenarthrobacter]|uniref:FG-GAP-like repeat-containing protein n=1 Tax=Paenarthrobacter TaxID=1742992 RepID=UPI001F61C526|nr:MULTISPECIES: FG-GAP-like repeat-containing protein [Paenarthrobacter]WOC60746.1 FG-GAP-like repeat-containing protein [Paenarthrobacter sp. AT5]
MAVPARYVYTNGTPRLEGDPTVGGLLKVDISSTFAYVIPEGGTPAISYSWTRDGVVIPGATSITYRPTSADLGRVIAANLIITYDAESHLSVQAENPLRVAAAARARGFNGDNTLDIFARDGSGRLILYPTDGRGNWQAPQVIGWGWNIFNLLMSPGDFDGDGTVDVLARDGQGRLFLYQGNGSGGWKRALQVGQGWDVFKELTTAGDFNGDGTNDVLAKDASGSMFLYPGNGRGGWLTPVRIGQGWQDLETAGAGHFFGDHNVVVLSKDWTGYLQARNGIRNGWFNDYGIPGSFAGNIGWGWETVARFGSVGDFNGDGDYDVYGIDRSGKLTMYLGDPSNVQRRGTLGYRWKGSAVVGWGWGGFTAVF